MLTGDHHIRTLGQKAIILVGETKVGKSTLFNYLQNKQLRAVSCQTGDDVFECVQKNVAEASSEMKSATLIPNYSKTTPINGVT